jgi:uncharacterized membrane protein YjdF
MKKWLILFQQEQIAETIFSSQQFVPKFVPPFVLTSDLSFVPFFAVIQWMVAALICSDKCFIECSETNLSFVPFFVVSSHDDVVYLLL